MEVLFFPSFFELPNTLGGLSVGGYFIIYINVLALGFFTELGADEYLKFKDPSWGLQH